MNTLFIAPALPSRLHRIRAYQLIQYLSKYHRIYLLSLGWKETDTGLDETEHFCTRFEIIQKKKYIGLFNAGRFLFSLLPLEVAYCRDSAMNKKVSECIRKYQIDVVYIKRLRAAQFVQHCPVPVLLDTTDAMSLFYRRAAQAVPWYQKPLYYEEAVKYRWYEKKMLQKFKHWIVSSPVDAAYLRALAPSDTSIHVVPNGVDTEYFSPRDGATEKHTILFSGLMSKFVNIEAARFMAEEIFPLILKKVPDAKLKIVGPNPTRKIKKLAGPHIEVTGLVSDLRDYIAGAEVVVCPVKTGAGTRNKILQAWAMKKPVVSTTAGAEGLDYNVGTSILIADTPDDFARKVVSLFKDTALRDRIAEGGLALVREKYDMRRIVETLNSIIENVRRAK